MTYFRIGALVALAAAFVGACSTNVNQGDSETHWIVCSTDVDCESGQFCEEKHCVGVAAPDGGAAHPITNPTGTCVAPNNGARAGYHSPGAGDVWLPDCQNTLKREYWRVFATSVTSASVIPRPDGAFQITGSVCLTPDHPLRALVDKYGLCHEAADTADVERVNDMDPADALAITHYLHTQLLFSAEVNPLVDPTPPPTVVPSPIPSDILDACALHPGQNSVALQAACEQQRQDVASGVDIGRDYGTVAAELVPLLNELYGVGASCPAGEFPRPVCMRCGLSGGCPQVELRCTKPCTTSADCAGVSAGKLCMMQSCGPVMGCI